jgi:hypothetical protein
MNIGRPRLAGAKKYKNFAAVPETGAAPTCGKKSGNGV